MATFIRYPAVRMGVLAARLSPRQALSPVGRVPNYSPRVESIR